MRTQHLDLVTHNARTLATYEAYARNYALLTGRQPDPDRRYWLERLCREIGTGARLLEIGSGTGRDADYLERLGVQVRRSDAAQAFLDIQAERGSAADLLNVVTDDIAPPGDPGYDAIVALGVLIHVDRPALPGVLGKVRAALRPQRGLFLVSMREGERDDVSPGWFVSHWGPGQFERVLIEAAFVIEGTGRYVDSDGDVWRTSLCRREA